MDALLRFSAAIDRLNRALGRGVAWLTLAMVLVGATNALVRYVGSWFQASWTSNALLELQWYLFSLVFLLGAPYALRAGAHVRVDVLYARLSQRGQAWIDLVGGLLLLIPFCVFAIWVSYGFVADSWATREASNNVGGLARYPLKSMLPVAFLLIALQGASEVVKRLAIVRGRAPHEVGLDEPEATA